MDEYIAKHRSAYLDRIRVQEEEEAERLCEKNEKIVREMELGKQLAEYALLIQSTERLDEVSQYLDNILDGLRTSGVVIHKNPIFIKISMDILNAINENTSLFVNLQNCYDVSQSTKIKQNMGEIFDLCGSDNGGLPLDVEFAMDCTKDEEIARMLEQEFNLSQFMMNNSSGDEEDARPTRRRRVTSTTVDEIPIPISISIPTSTVRLNSSRRGGRGRGRGRRMATNSNQ